MTQRRLNGRKMGPSDQKSERQHGLELELVFPDPWRFDMDPDPRIRIRFKIRILLFPSVTLKMPTKNKIFFLSSLLTVCTFTSVFIENKLLSSHKTVKNQGFLRFFRVVGRIRIRTNTYGSESRKNFLFQRIRNTGWNIFSWLSRYGTVTWRTPGRGCATPWRWTRC
jgi:hypothetical protein